MLTASTRADSVLIDDLPAVEQRSFPRFRRRPAHPVRLTVPEIEEAPRVGSLYDVSAGGVGLLVDRPVDLGVVLALEVLTWSGARMRLVARVTHTTRQPVDRWLVGCALYQPLTDEELGGLL